MMNNNLRPKNFIFLCLSAGIFALGQLPMRMALGAELEENSSPTIEVPATDNQALEVPPIDNQALEIPSLPSLGAADDYLPIAPSTTPVVVAETLRLELRLGERKVYVFNNDEIIASYPVAIGRAGWETPTGNFVVRDMIENPGWENFRTGEVMPPGEDNPLGVRWISFWTDGVNEIGFHGTTDEELIGQAVSHGCVRMRNQDVTALFSKVAIGTPVVVKP
jgi:L,D-transpeptidase ErfK/SrfK